MKCYKHNSEEIVVQCHECGKGLCSSCSNRFTRILCESCLINNNQAVKGRLVRELALAAAIFVSFSWFQLANMTGGFFHNIGPVLFFSYFFACIPWGWNFLSRLTPQIFLVMPFFGWVVYFVLKLPLSVLMGWIVAPFKLYKAVSGLKEMKLTQQQLEVGAI